MSHFDPLMNADAAMSSGASVLVHCAAGISRSPALAVAYVMYSSGMDLDQAYRLSILHVTLVH